MSKPNVKRKKPRKRLTIARRHNGARRRNNASPSRDRIVERERRDASVLANVPRLASITGGKQIVLVDPPWKYRDDGAGRRGAAANHYPCQTLEALMAMGDDVRRIVVDDAMLLMWATSPLLPDALRLLEAWGFKYISSCVWHKTGRLGMGSIFRIDHEILLVGRRGKGVPVSARNVRSVIAARFCGHSSKPDAAYDAIERLWPHQPKIELFARKARDGWDRWGAEAPQPPAITVAGEDVACDA